MILFGKASLRRCPENYVAHYHGERNHQSEDNLILFPETQEPTTRAGPIQCRERLGGLLKFYHRGAG